LIVNPVVDAQQDNNEYVEKLFGKDRFDAKSAAE